MGVRALLVPFNTTGISASANSPDQLCSDNRGALFILNVTEVTGTTPTLDVKIQYKCQVAGVYIDIPGASFTQKTATGADSLLVYPGVTETANRDVSSVLALVFRVVATLGGTTPTFSFTVSAALIP